ncbi:MAG: hypothetical protein JSV15_07245 [Candidatus Bathyarchaeota archaeon]|nr:MAG: hypothetical protein JSV15_07245 [Candidatus Bathyarchaeota archaeon]
MGISSLLLTVLIGLEWAAVGLLRLGLGKSRTVKRRVARFKDRGQESLPACTLFVKQASIVRFNLVARRSEVLRRSSDVKVDAEYLSIPKAAEFPSEKELPFAYVPFDANNTASTRREYQRSFDAELYFYSKIFSFKVTSAVEPMEIENL